jgi:glycosyltransferase involved in cell wall biosynthesis
MTLLLTQRMKSVTFFSSFPLEYGAGGEATCLYLANYLGSNGYQVKFVFDSGRRVETRLSSEAVRTTISEFEYSGEPFVAYAPAPADLPFRALPTIDALSSSDLSIVLLDRVPPPSFLTAVRDCGCPVLFLFFGLAVERPLPPNPLGAAYQVYIRGAFRAFELLSSATHTYMLVLTEDTRRELIQCHIPPNRIFIVPSGIDFSTVPAPVAHNWFGVAFMGRMVASTKGIDLLAKILDRLEGQLTDQMKVEVIGSGIDSRILHRFRGNGQIRYLGFVPDNERTRILQTSDLLLVTSYVEPFSLATVEGLAAGLFVLTTPASGPSSIVRRWGGFGEILGYDPDVFVGSIMERYKRWAVSPAGSLEERNERRRRCMDMYSATTMAESYLRIVKGIS